MSRYEIWSQMAPEVVVDESGEWELFDKNYWKTETDLARAHKEARKMVGEERVLRSEVRNTSGTVERIVLVYIKKVGMVEMGEQLDVGRWKWYIAGLVKDKRVEWLEERVPVFKNDPPESLSSDQYAFGRGARTN